MLTWRKYNLPYGYGTPWASSPTNTQQVWRTKMHVTRNSDFGYGYAHFLPMTVGDDAHVVPFSVKDETILHHTPCGRLTPPPKKPALRRLFLIRFQCFPFISPLLLPVGKAKKGAKQS